MEDNQEDQEFDVLIAGASVSGLCLANYLARKGLKILIVDLKRIKNVGSSVSAKLFKKEAVTFLKNSFNIRIPKKFIERVVEETEFTSINNKGFDYSSRYYVINKKKLTGYLIGKIISLENVKFLERHNILELLEEDREFKGVKVRNVSRGNVKELRASIIVDASGSTAVLRREAPENRFFKKEVADYDQGVVYEEVLKLENGVEKPRVVMDPSRVHAGYFWLIPEAGSKVSAGLIIGGKTKSVKEKYEKYKKTILEQDCEEVLDKSTGLEVMRRPLNSFVYRNLMLVGSAACQVNPIIIRDVNYGLKGAYHAGKAILSSLKDEEVDTKKLWDYNKNFMQEVGARCALLELVKDFFSSLTTEELDYVIENEVVGESIIKNVDTRFKKRDIIFNSGKLILKPKLLPKFLKLSYYSSRMNNHYNNYPSYSNFPLWCKKVRKELNSIRSSFLV